MDGSKPGACHTALVVDDDPINLRLTRALLEYDGYAVRLASTAQEALQVLQEFRAGLILLDLRLPGIDGFELARRLRADTATAAATVVAMTAYATREDEAKALAAGCHAVLVKPLDPRALARLLPTPNGTAPARPDP